VTDPSILRRPTKRQRGFCCTYGNDDDVIPGAPRLKRVCGRSPVVLVDRKQMGVGRCAKHKPKARS
jgi:hypothetical protein